MAKKQTRNGETITLTGYEVSKPAQDVKVAFKELHIHLPGLPEDCPAYIWRNAVGSIWIAIQGRLRTLTTDAIKAYEGHTFNGADLSDDFETKKQQVDNVTKAQRLAAKMSPAELAALRAMLAENA